MPIRRSLSAVAAAVALSAGLLAGCSSQSSSGEDTANLPDAATLLTQSAETTRAQQSVHLLLTTQGSEILANLPIERLEGDLTTVPAVAAQGTVDLNSDLIGKLENVPFTVADGNLYAALQQGGRPLLIGPAADIYDVSAILNPEIGLANMLGSFSGARSEAREEVAGTATIKITGTVSAEAVNKIAPSLEVTGAVPGTAWIREDGDHELVQAKIDTSEGNSIQMETTEWGTPVTVTAPEAA